jgi:2-polyprenyl-3-methyl-5-hydroxy-6-metoxy-1,4-benzoquinol methylase
MLITEEYKTLNTILHERKGSYGSSLMTRKYYPHISELAKSQGVADIIDYGCGKGNMAIALSHLLVTGYDPAVKEFSEQPESVDMVCCLDVLEHIEPDCLDDVLAHIQSLAKKCVFLTIHVGPARKILADGRNAHLIQEPYMWWMTKLHTFWNIRLYQAKKNELLFFAIPHHLVADPLKQGIAEA